MLVVIGCGNSNRSDDGVGVFVAQALQKRLRDHPRNDVRIFDAGTGGMDVMFQARGAKHLIVVDASSSGSDPGAIFEVPGAELQREHAPSFTLHDFRWEHALAAGRLIFREQFPDDVSVFLIEAQSLDPGLELSPRVRSAAMVVFIRLARVIDEYDAGPG
jgi:hydrogenase maturation protease